MSARRKTIASLFSGAGGWEAGAVDAGLKPVLAVEYVPEIAALYRANFGPHVQVGDVRTFARRLPIKHADVLVSSPPCQGHSKSGKAMAAAAAAGKFKTVKDRFLCDPAVGLATLDYVDALSPSLVIIENAQGYEKTAPGKALIEGLHARGLGTISITLKAWQHGVPSGRIRSFILADRNTAIYIPDPEPVAAWWPAIRDLKLPKAELAPYNRFHLSRRPPPSYPAMLSGSTSGTQRARLTWRTADQTGWTATTAKSSSAAKVLLSPHDARQMTVRAWARLQGWPDWYSFDTVGRYAALHVIGNSMPPALAQRILTSALYGPP